MWGSVMSIEMGLVIGEGRSLQNAKKRAAGLRLKWRAVA